MESYKYWIIGGGLAREPVMESAQTLIKARPSYKDAAAKLSDEKVDLATLVE